MFTQRLSDETWIKYLLSSGLVSVVQLQTIRGGQNQVNVAEVLCKHPDLFDTDVWINKALQQDRFHFIPRKVQATELYELEQHQPNLVTRCMHEGILPLSYLNQILYLGLLRFDPEFPELQEILSEVPPDLMACLVPLAPKEYTQIAKEVTAVLRH